MPTIKDLTIPTNSMTNLINEQMIISKRLMSIYKIPIIENSLHKHALELSKQYQESIYPVIDQLNSNRKLLDSVQGSVALLQNNINPLVESLNSTKNIINTVQDSFAHLNIDSINSHFTGIVNSRKILAEIGLNQSFLSNIEAISRTTNAFNYNAKLIDIATRFEKNLPDIDFDHLLEDEFDDLDDMNMEFQEVVEEVKQAVEFDEKLEKSDKEFLLRQFIAFIALIWICETESANEQLKLFMILLTLFSPTLFYFLNKD